MPGGYGTRDTPWGAGGTKAPSGSFSRSAGPASGGGSSVTQGSNQQANRINRQREQQSDAYIMDASNFIDPRQQLAASLKAAGAVTSGALSGNAFWKKAPVGSDPRMQEILDENENVYYSTFGPGSEPYSDSAQEFLTGYGGLTEVYPSEIEGREGEIGKIGKFNIYGTPQFPTGNNNQSSSNNNYNYRRGYDSLGQQMYAMGLPGIMYGDMQGENRYSPLNMNEFMVNVHSPMYANRGGIIDLLGDY